MEPLLHPGPHSLTEALAKTLYPPAKLDEGTPYMGEGVWRNVSNQPWSPDIPSIGYQDISEERAQALAKPSQ